MSTTIDERVVEMRFDNKQFEKNVQTSMSTIDKLKQSLNLTGAAKGLENVNAAAKKCDMTPLSNAVESVRLKFSALEVMAATALANITNSAVNAGKRIVSALTIDPIKTGFQEYETQINAVQTILANTQSKGTTLDQVNAALDELNKYADQTIYNFTEMTRNIGTFTAAGVDLDKSVTSIKGIANLAAASGSNAQQASTAMYQLSQAIAAGRVSLEDWNSVVNAGMGGQLFQDALKRTAEHFGVNMDAMIEKYGSFRQSLTEGGWLTTEVLTETLTQLSGAYSEADLIAQGYTEEQAKEISELAQTALDAATKVKTFTQLWDTLKESVQSGWTQSWEIVVGDFEEAKELLTEVSNALGNMVNASSEARNKMLQTWKDLGGRTALIESIKNAFEGVLSIIKPIKEGFREIFPPTTGKQLYNLTVGLQELTEKFKIGETTANNLKRTFKGVFALFDIGLQGIKALVGGFADLIGYVAPAGDGILGFTANIGDFIVRIDEAIKSSDAFNKAIEGIGNFLKPIADGVKTFVKTIADAFSEFANIDTSGLDTFADKVQTRFEPFVKLGELVKKALEGIGKIVSKIFPTITKLGSIMGSALGKLGDIVSEAFQTANFDTVFDLINGGLFAGILVGVRKFIKSLTNITESGGGILGSLKGILDGVKGSLEAWQSSIKAGTLLKIAGAMAILTASIIALSLVDSEKLTSSLGAMSVLFVELFGSMAVFEKIMNGPGFKGMTSITLAMIGLSTAILILSGAVKKMSDLEWEGLAKGLTGVAGIAAILIVSANSLSKTSGKLIRGSVGLVIFAASIRVLVEAVGNLGALDTSELTKGLIGVGVICAELAAFLKVADLDGMGVLKGTGLLLLATSVKILSTAVAKFADIDTGGMVKGLVAVGVVLGELAAFTKLTGNAKHVFSTAVGMTVLGAAMVVFGEAVEKMGNLSWDQIGKGLITMAGALTAITIAVKSMPTGMVSKATGMIGMAAALIIVGEAVEKMGNLSWEEIGRGLTTLAGAMVILAVALNAMKSTLSGATAMLVISAALAVLTPVIKIMGGMSWEEIAKGLITLAGSFTIIGIAGAVLGPLAPSILALSGAIAVLGVGCLAAGAGILAFSAGLSALAVSGTAGAAALVVAISSILSIIPLIFKEIGEGILALAGVIKNGGPAIAEAFTVLILAAVDALVTAVPVVVDGLFVLLDNILSALVEYTPTIVEKVFDILIGVLQAIASKLPELIQAGVEVLMAFFAGVIEALGSIDVEVLVKGVAAIGLLSAIMIALGAVASLIPAAMVGVLGMGVVMAELALVLAAVGALAQIPGLSWLIGEGGKLLQGIGIAIGQFVGGIVGGFMSGVSSQFPQIGSDLSAFMTNVQPFIDGASKINPSMMEGIKSLAGAILVLTAADILNGLTSWFTGGSSLSDFATQLVPFGVAMAAFSMAVTGMNPDVVTSAAIAGKTLAEMAATLPNSGGVLGFFAGENDMKTFAAQLVPFGVAMTAFSLAVTGMNPDTVTNAAIAGKAVAEMAATLPNSGGVWGFFTGENDMDAFGEQLVPFGEAMKKFSIAAKGIEPDTVTNAAIAGKALAEMANNLPNSGGVWGFFTGENDMDAFGEQLVPFGEAMKKFSIAAKGIEPDVITSSATAAKSLSELANNLPNDGGVVSWFTGDNNIGDFGESLAIFGEGFSKYAKYMEDVKPEVVTATTNAAVTLVELANSLPNKGGFGSLFTGDNDIGEFGESLSMFGSCFAGYYEQISGINASKLSSVIGEVGNLISIAKDASDVDIYNFSSFGYTLEQLGNTGIDGFIAAFTDATSRVKTAATEMLSAFVEGAKSKQLTLNSAFTVMVAAALQSINGKQSSFATAGMNLITKVSNGIRIKSSMAINAIADTMKNVISNIESHYSSFYDAGSYLADGFANGISANTYKAEAKSKEMAAAAAEAARKELDEHSPSRVGYQIGDYFGVAFVNAVGDYASKAYKAGSEMADSAKSGLSNAISKITDVINGNIDTQPSIRPVLDLSNVEQGARRIHSLFSTSQAMSISSAMNRENDRDSQNGESTSYRGNTYQFTQNNYSPKALSRVEIYRQTKNQFSAMERMVET